MLENQRASISPARLLRRQVVLEEHDPLPGGGGAVVVERFVRAETYRSHLHLVHFGPSRATVPLTAGAVRDTSPRVSPDGRRLAFLRSFPDEPDRLTAVMVGALDGGEPWVLWVPKHGVAELAWSPDGSRLAFVAAGAATRFIIGPETKGRVVTARRITRADWRWDGVGHRDRWDQVWVIAARRGARSRQLTHGEADVKGIAWAPDGRWIACAADPRPDADIRPRPSIWVVPTVGGEPREAIRLAGYAGSPSFSPDGRWLACIGVDVADPLDDEQPGLFIAPVASAARRTGTSTGAATSGTGVGTGADAGAVADADRGDDGADRGPDTPPRAVALAPDLDRPIGAWNDTDLNGWMASARPGPSWDGPASLVALVSEGGRVRPWRFPVDPATGRPAGAPERLVDGDIAAWTLGVAGGVVSIVATVDDRPMELLALQGGGPRAARRARTTLGGAWRRGLPWPEMRRVLVPGEGGPIETWIVSPAGAGEAALPTVVNVHGGPLGAWSPAPSTENVLLAAHGYRVILPNIRGSAGYGRAWIRPQLGDWGGVDAADVLAAVDHVVGLGLADPERLGVLGLSYGGFMVNWLVGAAPGRFRAAVSENGVTNQLNDWANSDSGPEYDRMALLGDSLGEDSVAKLWRQSPLRHVTRIRTPLLMLQGEADLRCPAADNEQLFVALRHLGREVEYVLYPESWHTFAITGRIDRRIDRNERVLAWFDRFLKE
jgi:dipeptidyl aminopeptidase/acylaminoacyl peptidase